METKEIKELIELLQGTDYRYIEIKNEGTSILLSKDQERAAATQSVPTAQPIAAGSIVMTTETAKEIVKEQVTEHVKEQVQVAIHDADCFVVKSPIVGTYYSSSGPEAATNKKKGDKVKKGDVLCIIEAMKLMNEIDCDVDGEIIEILLGNEAVVEYGQPLFKLKTK